MEEILNEHLVVVHRLALVTMTKGGIIAAGVRLGDNPTLAR